MTSNHKVDLEIVDDVEALAKRSVELFVFCARQAIDEKGCFRFAISGGLTPRRFYEILGQSQEARELGWSKIHVFWVDERYVPSDSNSSNFKLAYETFLKDIDIPNENIHKIPTENNNAEISARIYGNIIKAVFGTKEKDIPIFDLIILGMGSDGHTGSLFPNCYASFDTDDLACVVYVMDEKLNRITLTHPVISAAKKLVVLVSGKEKAKILKKVMKSEPDDVRYPIHFLWPVLEKVTWIVDKNAARYLK